MYFEKIDLRNEKGFTLIEVFAVLVILGILGAVAVQKYMNVANSARQRAAQGAIAEIKGRLSSAQAKYMMVNRGRAPTSQQLYSYATTGTNAYGSPANFRNVGSDFNLTTSASTARITITVTRVRNITVTPSVVGYFNAAGN
jgi:prepilin-type N-terminal cleavage/methylation domain-containing protein